MRAFNKRALDLFLSGLACLFLSPLMALIALWIKSDSPGPVFFLQTRVGRYGQRFSIYKFRTMYVEAERQGQITIGYDQRVTRAGRWLRKSKLDELPQLVNVLYGQMSLVGPRPEVPRYVACYPDAVRTIVLSVRPGITDWASLKMIDENELLGQANDPERYYIEHILPQKLDYYVRYVHKHNMREDIHILLATVLKVFTR